MYEYIRHDVLKYCIHVYTYIRIYVCSSTAIQYLYNIYNRQVFKSFMKQNIFKKFMK